MIDPDLNKHLENINTNLADIKNKKSPGIWRAFFNGVFSALGYVGGLILAALVVGWILNKMGFLPDVQKQIKDFQSIMEQAKRVMVPGQGQEQQGSGAKGSYQIIMPDGQKVNVNQ